MSSHRYWRVRNIVSAGGGALELTEFQLLDGVSRVDAAVTLTSNIAPSTGTLSSLQDNAANQAVGWASPEGLTLDWDFGTPTEVNNFLMGAAGSGVATFPWTLTLQWSDDGVAYTTARSNDYYVFPGAYKKTNNVLVPPRVRAVGALNAINGARTTLACPSPSSVEVGDLLVVALVTSVDSSVGPSGFVRRAVAGVAGNSNIVCEIWTRVVTSEAEKSPGSWTNVIDVQALSISGGIRPPVFESQNTVATGLANVSTQAVPGLVAAGDARLGVSAAYWALAFGAGVTDMDIQVRPPWVKRLVAIDYLRLGMATIPLDSGVAMSGTWSTQATNSSGGGGWSIVSMILAGQVQIEIAREGLAPVRGLGILSRTVPLQPIPTQAQNGTPRMPVLARLRRDFYHPLLGQGIGRLKGTVKDKGSPNVPVSERTVLFRQTDCQPVREVLSAPSTGAYSFDYIDETQTYFVVSFDHDGAFRAVIADGLNLANGGVELIE